MKNRREGIDLTPDELFLYKKTLFKSELIKQMHHVCKRAELYSAGNISFTPGWKDWLGIASFSTVTTLSSGIVASTVSFGIIGAVLAPAITIPIAIVGLGAGIGFSVYRFEKKRKEYNIITDLCEERDLDKDFSKLADCILSLYENGLKTVRLTEIKKLAKSLVNILNYAMMKGKVDDIETLLKPQELLSLLVSLDKKIPKQKIATEINGTETINARGFFTKPGIYCETTKTIYTNHHTRPEKYGIVRLKTKEQWHQFNEAMNNEGYHASPVSSSKYIINQSIFKPIHEQEEKEDDSKTSNLLNIN